MKMTVNGTEATHVHIASGRRFGRERLRQQILEAETASGTVEFKVGEDVVKIDFAHTYEPVNSEVWT